MHTLMPNQVLFVSDGDKVPRLILGREALALQGFPIDVLDIMDPDGTLWSEATLHDLAGNMVPAPGMQCAMMVAMEAAPWIDIEHSCCIHDDQAELDATFMRELEDGLMYQEAEQEGAVAASCLPSHEPLRPVHPPPAKFSRGMLSRLLSAAPPAPVGKWRAMPLLSAAEGTGRALVERRRRRAMPLSPGHALVTGPCLC